MRFVGVNEMVLNNQTLRAALELWMNERRVDELAVTQLRVRRNGEVVVKFARREEVKRQAVMKGVAA